MNLKRCYTPDCHHSRQSHHMGTRTARTAPNGKRYDYQAALHCNVPGCRCFVYDGDAPTEDVIKAIPRAIHDAYHANVR